MKTQTAQPPPSSSSSSAYPRWVLLEQYCSTHFVYDSFCSTGDDANTPAAARTRIGHLIQVSLRIREPRATWSVYIQVLDGVEEYRCACAVVAAHGDSLLIRVEEVQDQYGRTTDLFIYNAGDAAADPPRPPSLSLLPPCYVFDPTDEEWECRHMDGCATGLLRHGENELMVAELSRVPELKVADLFLFCSGEWSVKHLPIPISCGDGDAGKVSELPFIWHAVVPVGDRLLCWVHLLRDILIICDVFEESPRLQYLRIPKDPCLEPCLSSGPRQPNQYRNVCATAGGGALKFINLSSRCCCGGAGVSDCQRSRHAYTIRTWILWMDKDNMEWVMDGMVDATELWGLDAYKGLPCVPLDYPVVSMDDPHVAYFQLCERHYVCGGDDTRWLLKVDMRSKIIQAASRYDDGLGDILIPRYDDGWGDILIPSNVSYFFNPSDGTLTRQRQMGIDRPPAVVVDEQPLLGEDYARNPTLRPFSPLTEPSEQASEFLEAFLEISRYGFYGDELLKAYTILSHDNGRRFRSLLRLPKDLRKDWLLMEIKASQAY